MKKSLIFISVASVALAGVVVYALTKQEPPVSSLESPVDSTPVLSNSLAQEPKDTPHEVSLSALFEKEYDGRDLKLGRVLEEHTAYTRYYITYKSEDLTISGIMNVPKGEWPFPLLVLNHGHIDTAIYTNGRGLRREQDYLARQGYVVLHPDYRGHADSSDDPESEYRLRLGYTIDVINAVYAAKAANFGFLDASRVGMLGHSMGGGITQNVFVVEPGLVQAAALYAPVSMDARDSFERWTKTRTEIANEIVERYGAPDASPQFWDNVSAKTFVDRIATPVTYYHGTADESVPYEWSVSAEALLRAAGKDVTLVTYEGERHEFGFAWLAFMESVTKFFDERFKKGVS